MLSSALAALTSRFCGIKRKQQCFSTNCDAEQEKHSQHLPLASVARSNASIRRLKELSGSSQMCALLIANNSTASRSTASNVVENLEASSVNNFDWSFPVPGRGGTMLMLLFEVDDLYTLRALNPFTQSFCEVIQHRYDLTILRPDGNNALHVLTLYNVPTNTTDMAYKFALALLRTGCHVDARGHKHNTALLQWACNSTRIDNACFALLLFQFGADVNAVGEDKVSMLHILVRFGHSISVSQLVDADVLLHANLNLRDAKNRTPLDLARLFVEGDPTNVKRHGLVMMLESLKEVQRDYSLARLALLSEVIIPDIANIINELLL